MHAVVILCLAIKKKKQEAIRNFIGNIGQNRFTGNVSLGTFPHTSLIEYIGMIASQLKPLSKDHGEQSGGRKDRSEKMGKNCEILVCLTFCKQVKAGE